MISLICSFMVLVLGYIFYGRFVAKVIEPDDRITPAFAKEDGVDFVPMKTWKAFLVQLLNIAGTGPIFGALMGACFGPVVFLWIIFGAILGGGVHDFMSGMISERHDGASIAELSGIYLGPALKWIMRAFSVLLLLLTGTVFVTSPAALLAKLTPDFMNANVWIVIILLYYILATLLPIDKIIGRLYPVFGVVLITMAAGILFGIVYGGYTVPEISLSNLHPQGLPVWPYMFVTVACGAISGFHATQSPLVAKCITSEKVGRKIFYGAMLSESVIALVWAAGGVAFYGVTSGLFDAISAHGQSGVVYDISKGMLGTVGGVLAIVGVVACPVTSGDTAFRSARLILAEVVHLDQKKLKNRLIITLPLLGLGALLTQLDFNVLWRYFSWSNQTLAMITLWVATVYLIKTREHKWYSIVTAMPAAFMSAVSLTYILMASEGFGIKKEIAYPIGCVFAALQFIFYLLMLHKIIISGKYRPDDKNETDQEG
ncbi:MAG: carbon starvation protein A [Eubacterium sp.]|nr:carbon starvation protein A [Eubacterium sp.]